MKDTLFDAALEALAERGGLQAAAQLAHVTELLARQKDARGKLAHSLALMPTDLTWGWGANLRFALQSQPGHLDPWRLLTVAVTCDLQRTRLKDGQRIDAALPGLVLQRNGSEAAMQFPEIFRAAPVACLAGLSDTTVDDMLDKLDVLDIDFGPYAPAWAGEVATLTKYAGCRVLDRYATELRGALARRDGPVLGTALLRALQGIRTERREIAQHLLRMVSLQELGSRTGALSLLIDAAWHGDHVVCMQIAAQGYLSNEDILTSLDELHPFNDGHSMIDYGHRLVVHADACRRPQALLDQGSAV